MGLIDLLLGTLFGNGRNVIKDTAEVFLPNAEAGAQRSHDARRAALQQFGSEFLVPRRGTFDRFMDALNRVPRPALAFGTLGMFIAAMVDPVWFAARMAGIALVPEPLWWLLGAIVSFYFGARHQAKGQDFQRDLVKSMAVSVPEVVATVRQIERASDADDEPGVSEISANPALTEWRKRQDADQIP